MPAPSQDPCEQARQSGATLEQYWECTKKVLKQIADKINPNGEDLQPTFGRNVDRTDAKSRTPEKLALILAKSAQEVHHHDDAVLVSRALILHLLQNQRKNRTILFDALKIYITSLPDLHNPRDTTLQTLKETDKEFFDALEQYIKKR